MDAEIKIEVLMSIDDIKNYWRFLYCRGYQKYVLTVGIVIGGLSFSRAFLHHNQLFDAPNKSLLVITLFLIWLSLILYLVVMFVWMPTAKSYFQSNKFLQDNQLFVFSKDKLKIETEIGQSDFPWSYLYSVEENKNYFFIFIDKVQAFIIPKSSVPNIDDLKTLFKHNLQTKQLKLLK